MDRDERTRLWARDTRGLRFFSALVGALACLLAVLQLVLVMMARAPLAASAAACLPAVGTAIAGLFAMWVGRVLATIAEIAWFASPENPARGNADPPGGEPPRTPR